MSLISCQILQRNLAPLVIIAPGHEGARRLVSASVPSCHRSLQVLYYLAYESEPQKLARAHVTGNSPRRYVLLLALICTHVYRNTKHSFDWPHHNRAVQCSDRFCRVKLLRQHLKEYSLSLNNNSYTTVTLVKHHLVSSRANITLHDRKMKRKRDLAKHEMWNLPEQQCLLKSYTQLYASSWNDEKTCLIKV